jgi:hypothetical protein
MTNGPMTMQDQHFYQEAHLSPMTVAEINGMTKGPGPCPPAATRRTCWCPTAKTRG